MKHIYTALPSAKTASRQQELIAVCITMSATHQRLYILHYSMVISNNPLQYLYCINITCHEYPLGSKVHSKFGYTKVLMLSGLQFEKCQRLLDNNNKS